MLGIQNVQYTPPGAGEFSATGIGGLGSHPELEHSGAKTIDQLTGVGVGFTILIITVAILLFVVYLQYKRNNSLVDQILVLVPTATASVLQSVADFKQGLSDFKQFLKDMNGVK